MVKKIVGSGIVFGMVAFLALPFAREVYARHTVMRHLDGVISASDRAAFANWSGSAQAFAATLRDRCLRENIGRASACERYRTATN